MKSISGYLDGDYTKWGDKPYISVKTGNKYSSKSFKETIDDVRNLSKALLKNGFKGKNIMIYSENSYEWMVLYLSIMGYVGVCVPVDKEWTSFDIENTLNSIDVSVIFYSCAKSENIEKLKPAYPNITYLCINDDFKTLLNDGKKDNAIIIGETDMHKTVMILFTSGTTSIPKAIPLTQSNLFNNWNTLFARTPMTEADVSYVFLPLNHVYSGVANFLYTIISGMQVYLCSDISLTVQEMMEVCPTIVCTVPLFLKRMYLSITDEMLEMLKKIRFLYCGGSFTEPHIKKFFVESGVNLLEAYGTTETSSVIAIDIVGDKNIESNGVVFENLDVKIIDKDENGIGEIIVKGGSVSKGYLNRNEDDSEFDRDGYYHTGDLARLDETNHLYLKGRKQRMIITANGKKIFVDEIEKLILENKSIKSVKVFEENYHAAASVVSDLSEIETRKYIDEVNNCLPEFKKIKKVYVTRDTLGVRMK